MTAYQAGAARVSSTVTKQNPRPRKYATASERQAAYRARAPEVCFRAEPKTVDKLDEIAQTIDQSRADLLLSMTKFALANHDWARFGLTHRPLPFGYGMAAEMPATNPAPIWKRKRPKSLGKPVPLTPKQKAAAKAMAKAAGRKYPNLVDNIAASRMENPTMKKPTPAQLAARAKFAEMARSGAFKRKANPMVISRQADESLSRQGSRGYVRSLLDRYSDSGRVVSVTKKRNGAIGIALDGGRLLTVEQATKKLEDFFGITETMTRKTNPRKKTVSEKISQLVREGYPQKQAVAVALSEQRAGKVKATPRKRNPVDMSTYPQPRPMSEVAKTILAQLGGNKFIAMTGAKNLLYDTNLLGFSIPRNMSKANRVTIYYNPGTDLYTMTFRKIARGGLDRTDVANFEDVYADQLRGLFTQVTGMETSLGTLGRMNNPRAANPATGTKKSRTKLNPQGKKVYVVFRTFATSDQKVKLATFDKMTDARNYAQAYSDAYKVRTAVKTVTE